MWARIRRQRPPSTATSRVPGAAGSLGRSAGRSTWKARLAGPGTRGALRGEGPSASVDAREGLPTATPPSVRAGRPALRAAGTISTTLDADGRRSSAACDVSAPRGVVAEPAPSRAPRPSEIEHASSMLAAPRSSSPTSCDPAAMATAQRTTIAPPTARPLTDAAPRGTRGRGRGPPPRAGRSRGGAARRSRRCSRSRSSHRPRSPAILRHRLRSRSRCRRRSSRGEPSRSTIRHRS